MRLKHDINKFANATNVPLFIPVYFVAGWMCDRILVYNVQYNMYRLRIQSLSHHLILSNWKKK